MTSKINYSTPLTVRVIAKGGKFLGADISGAFITIKNLKSGEILASGNTQGNSGGIYEIMIVERARTAQIPTGNASSFNADIPTESLAPIPLLITATGPGAGLQSQATASTTFWLIPGLKDEKGNAIIQNCLLELPGLLVQVVAPVTHTQYLTSNKISFTVNVAMMCGCPIKTGPDTDYSVKPPETFENPWHPDDFIVGCYIYNNDLLVDQIALSFNSSDSAGYFTSAWQMNEIGFYTAYIYAFQKSTGNSGSGTVSFFMLPPNP